MSARHQGKGCGLEISGAGGRNACRDACSMQERTTQGRTDAPGRAGRAMTMYSSLGYSIFQLPLQSHPLSQLTLDKQGPHPRVLYYRPW